MADYGGQNISRAFNVPSPYQTEQRRIEQQQKMAEMLQAQSMQPNERFSYNGIEARIPATAGLAKMLQGFTGMMMQKKGLEEEKALGEKYQSDLISTLGRAATLAAGTPERAAKLDPQEMEQMADQGTAAPLNIPAVAPNPQASAMEYFKHPALAPMGMQQLQREAQINAFKTAGGLGVAPTANQPAAPMQGMAPAATSPVASTTTPANLAKATSLFGGPAGGQPMNVWLASDPTGKSYTEQLAKDFSEVNKPTFGTGHAEIQQLKDGSFVKVIRDSSGREIIRPMGEGNKPYEKPPELPEQTRALNSAISGAGIDPNSPQGKAIFNAQIAKLVSHPEANKNITNVAAYLPASEEAQRDFMKSTRATYDQLKQAPTLLANIEEAKKLIPNAKQFMGPGGEPLLNAAKLLNNRLGTNIATTGVTDAETLRTRIFFNIMDNLKKMDASPSQSQQAIMQESLGNLGTDPNALPKILDAYADSMRQKISLHNDEVQGAVQRGVKFPYSPIIKLNTTVTPGRSNW